MSPSVVIGCHVILPLDDAGWSDRMIIVGGPMSLEDSLHVFDRPSVLVYSRRHLDITDESDAAHAVVLGSWLASSGIELVDWLIMTRRTVRSIPADFGLPRRW